MADINAEIPQEAMDRLEAMGRATEAYVLAIEANVPASADRDYLIAKAKVLTWEVNSLILDPKQSGVE